MGELVHPHHPIGALTLNVTFLVSSPDTLIHKAAVSHILLSVSVIEGGDRIFWYINVYVFYDTWISPPKAMSRIGAYSPGFS